MRFFDLRGGFEALLIEYPRIHPRQHIAFMDELPLFDQNRLDTPGNFGGDIDFRRLDAAITGGEARREPGRAQHPPCCGDDHRCNYDIPGPTSFVLIHTRLALFHIAEWCAFRYFARRDDKKGEIRPSGAKSCYVANRWGRCAFRVVIISNPGLK